MHLLLSVNQITIYCFYAACVPLSRVLYCLANFLRVAHKKQKSNTGKRKAQYRALAYLMCPYPFAYFSDSRKVRRAQGASLLFKISGDSRLQPAGTTDKKHQQCEKNILGNAREKDFLV